MPAPSPHDPVIVAGRRTVIGTAGHALADVPAAALAAPVLSALAPVAEQLGTAVAEVVLGNCLGPGGNVARSAALAAGLGIDVPAVTVDRQCGSGLEAVRYAAGLVRSAALQSAALHDAAVQRPAPHGAAATSSAGQSDTAARDGTATPAAAPLIVAGGVESASTAPWRFWPPTSGDGSPTRYTRAPFAPPDFPDPEMGPAADDLAAARGISRQRQDAYAASSHRRAVAVMDTEAYRAQIVPVGGLDRDQRPRPLTEARLAALPPAFAAHQAGATAERDDAPPATVTAGNASGISDGAAAVAITTAQAAAAAGLPAVRIVCCAVTAGDTAFPGAGAGPAALRALAEAGVTADALAVIEVVEAFAAVALAFADELGVDESRLCRDGGAIAYGHPWGASGAVALTHAYHQLLREGPGALGLVACAIGGGQGIAMVLETLPSPHPSEASA